MNTPNPPARGGGDGADRRETTPPRHDSGRRHHNLIDIPTRAVHDDSDPVLILWGMVGGATTVVALAALYVWATYWSN